MGEEILGARGLPGPRAPACAVGLQSQYPPRRTKHASPLVHTLRYQPTQGAGGRDSESRARKYKPRAGAALNLVSQDRQCEVEKRLLVR